MAKIGLIAAKDRRSKMEDATAGSKREGELLRRGWRESELLGRSRAG